MDVVLEIEDDSSAFASYAIEDPEQISLAKDLWTNTREGAAFVRRLEEAIGLGCRPVGLDPVSLRSLKDKELKTRMIDAAVRTYIRVVGNAEALAAIDEADQVIGDALSIQGSPTERHVAYANARAYAAELPNVATTKAEVGLALGFSKDKTTATRMVDASLKRMREHFYVYPETHGLPPVPVREWRHGRGGKVVDVNPWVFPTPGSGRYNTYLTSYLHQTLGNIQNMSKFVKSMDRVGAPALWMLAEDIGHLVSALYTIRGFDDDVAEDLL
jgi:hypothetical protein